jgi:hypothetical protein
MFLPKMTKPSKFTLPYVLYFVSNWKLLICSSKIFLVVFHQNCN